MKRYRSRPGLDATVAIFEAVVVVIADSSWYVLHVDYGMIHANANL